MRSNNGFSIYVYSQNVYYFLENNFDNIIYPVVAGSSWWMTIGINGLPIGISFGILDNLAIKYEYSNFPFLTTGSVGMSLLSCLKDSPIIHAITKSVSGLVAKSPSNLRKINTFRSISYENDNYEFPTSPQPPATPIRDTNPPEEDYKLQPFFFNLISFAASAIISPFLAEIPAKYVNKSLKLAMIGFNFGTRYEHTSVNFLNKNPQTFFLIFGSIGIFESVKEFFDFKYFSALPDEFVTSSITQFSYVDTIFNIFSNISSYLFKKFLYLMAENNFLNFPKIPNFISNNLLNIPKIPNFITNNFVHLPNIFFNDKYKLFFNITAFLIKLTISQAIVFSIQNLFTNSSQENFTSVDVSKKLKDVFKYIMNQKEFDNILYKQVLLSTMLHQLILNIGLNLEIIKGRIFTNLTSSKSKKVYEDIFSTTFNLLFIIISDFSLNMVTNNFCSKLKIKSDKYILDALKNNNVVIYLTKNSTNSDHDSKTLINELHQDFQNSIDDGGKFLTNGIYHYVSGIIAINYFYNQNLDIMYYTYLYSLTIGGITNFLSVESNKYEYKIKDHKTQIDGLISFRYTNPVHTSISDSKNLIYEKIELLNKGLYELEYNSKFYNSLNNLYKEKQDLVNIFVSTFILNSHVGEIKNLEKSIWTMIPLTSKLLKMNFYESSILDQKQRLFQVCDNLIELFKRIEEAYKLENSNIKSIKKIDTKNSVTIVDLKARYINSNKEIHINYLNLNTSIALFYGSNGCGKTTVCKFLKGFVDKDIIISSGSLEFTTKPGHEIKTIMTGQNQAFVPGATILDQITLCSVHVNKSAIADLLNEINVGYNTNNASIISILETKNNWESTLSGGQKNKIFFISALYRSLQNPMPNIVIFDEIFEYMDVGSKLKAKSMIKKYLSNHIVIIIDHHSGNNEDNFFTQKVSFVENEHKNITTMQNYYYKDVIQDNIISGDVYSDTCSDIPL